MTKFKKIIFVIVSLSILVLSMVLPSFAHTIDSTGSIDYDVYYYAGTYIGGTSSSEKVSFEDIDLTALPDNNLDTFYFTLAFSGVSGNGSTNYFPLIMAFNYLDRDFTTITKALGGTVQVSCSIEGKKITNLVIQYDERSIFYPATQLKMALQVFPSSTTLESDYKSIINSLDTEDKADLLYQIEELEGKLSSLNGTISSLNNTISSKNQQILDLNKEIVDLSFDKVMYDNKIKEQEETILALREGMENNNSLFSLFNGIGSGLYSFVNPFFSLSIGGITVGAMIAFICALVLMYFLIKIIVKAFGN